MINRLIDACSTVQQNYRFDARVGKEEITTVAEPTQEQLLTYIDAAKTFYERVKGTGYAPTDTQIHAMLAACGVYVALERIKTNRETLCELEQEEKDTRTHRHRVT